MSDQNQSKKSNLGPTPWGSEPIKGLKYDYLDIDEPPTVIPEPVVPQVAEFNAVQAQDFYQRIRGKIVNWANGAGAGKDITNFVLLVPDIMALLVRLMSDPRVSTQLKAEIALASGYIIVPVDLMPEAVMGPAGLIDDAIVGMVALNRVVKVMGQAGEDVLREYWDGEDDVLEKMEELLGKADQFVSGRVWTGIKKFMADAAEDLKDMGKKRSSGPVIEGSARPILPPNEQGGQSQSQNKPEDKSWLPPNERG